MHFFILQKLHPQITKYIKQSSNKTRWELNPYIITADDVPTLNYNSLIRRNFLTTTSYSKLKHKFNCGNMLAKLIKL